MNEKTKSHLDKVFALATHAHMLSSLDKKNITDDDKQNAIRTIEQYPDDTSEMLCSVHGVGVRLYWIGVAEGAHTIINSANGGELEPFEFYQEVIDLTIAQFEQSKLQQKTGASTH